MAVDYEATPLPGGEDAVSDGDAPELRVHPAAAVFPMLPPDELAALAADIAEHGQREPITLDADGVLIDGRNRLRACELAEVDPWFATLPADVDPVAYILSLNIARRHLTVGQRAMATVEVSAFFKNGSKQALADALNISRGQVSYAATVKLYAAELVPDVIAGALALNDAYQTARTRKAAESSKTAQLTRLQAAAPDLATLVVEERLGLSDALAAAEKRDREAAQSRATATRLYGAAVGFLAPGERTPAEKAAVLAPLLEPTDRADIAFTAAEAHAAADVLHGIAGWLADREGAHGSV
jgi:ParB-like chromosome segregation protein Spo0J